MALVKGTSSSKPKKPKKSPKGGKQYEPIKPAKPSSLATGLATVGKVVGETVSKGRSKTAEKIVGKPTTAGGTMTAAREGFSTPQSEMKHARMELANAKPKELAGKKLRAEVRSTRKERRQAGGKTTTYTGSAQGGSETRTKTTSKPKRDVIRSASQDRPGGGFKDVSNYQTPASFDKLPDTRFTPLPGGGSEGGGGGGATVTGQSLSGLTGSDLDSILKGAKKGRRQKRRRAVE
jgi:hypothetical protein